MNKTIFVKTDNPFPFILELRESLEREGVRVEALMPSLGRLKTKHVSVLTFRDASDAKLHGLRCDECFYFDHSDYMYHHRRDLTKPPYNGTPFGYILKTEVECESYYDKYKSYVNSIYGLARCNGKTTVQTKLFLEKVWGYNSNGIKKVIFNDPATIVFWTDGTKTVVKAQDGDLFDCEKGLAMAIVKKVYGNKGNYCNEFKKWLCKDEDGGEK